MERVVVIGGRSDYRRLLIQALIGVCNVTTAEESPALSKQDIAIKALPEFPDPYVYGVNHKKSKGDKRRDRSERRRKWGI